MFGNFLTAFNKQIAENQNLLMKALDTTTGSALIPENLDKEITNILQRLSPEISLINLKKISGNSWQFNRFTKLPSQGGAMGENGTTPVRSSTYTRASVTLKEIRRKGQVTDFAQDATEEVIDAVATEMENNLLAHIYDIINYCIWGNAHANVYEFSGLDYFVGALSTTNHYNRIVKTRYGITPSTLKELDDAIDYSNRKGGNKHARCLVMSPEMASLFSRLTTNVRDNREVKGRGFEQALINGGWRLWAYRDIPIIESSSVTPVQTMPTVTVTGTTGTSSGLGGATTLYFKIAEVTKDGEQLACAEVSQAITTADTITLGWTPTTDADGIALAYRYRVYCSNTAGGGSNTEKLVKIIPGYTYDSNGAYSGNVSSVTFSSNPASADPTVSAPASFAGITTTVPAHMRDDIPYEQESAHAVPETVFLWDLDPVQGLGQVPYTNTRGSQVGGLVTSEELAKTDAWRNFLLRSTMAMADRFEATSYIIRGLRTY
jgi:hypothetical protein